MTLEDRIKYVQDIADRYRKTAEHYDKLAESIRNGGPLASTNNFVNDLATSVVSQGLVDMLPFPLSETT